MKRLAFATLLATSACQLTLGGEGTGEGISYAFTTPYGQKVNPVNANEFEVFTSTSGSFDGYWCGASEYARRKLGASWSDRVYVASPLGPSVTTIRRSAVRFTLDPQALGIQPVDVNFRSGFAPGDSLSVSAASARCQVIPPFRI